MKKSCWKDKEVIDLFSLVEDVKNNNMPLKDAFKVHADKYSRKPNSVRNYYYYELEQLKKDIVKTKKLGIDLKKHDKTEFDYFTTEQKKDLIEKIDRLVENGMSVRKACFNLSNGDVNLMLRYQNKYRNFVAKQKEKKQQPNNIITFTKRKRETLSDNDINSLFLGLVRLVKRTAIEEYSIKSKQEVENANSLLRKAMVDINKKDKELTKLKDDILKLKIENSKLVHDIMRVKCEKVNRLCKEKKENELI